MSDLPGYIVDRVFDAPRELVWRAWTEPDLLQRWYGPGVETTIHRFDLEPGGTWLNEMRWGDNASYQKVVFQEVVPPERLVWHHSSSDSDWNVTTNPMMADWPSVLLTTVTFDDRGDRTHVRLSQVPFEATEAEIACFAAAMSGMDKGWASGFEVLDTMLAELRADP